MTACVVGAVVAGAWLLGLSGPPPPASPPAASSHDVLPAADPAPVRLQIPAIGVDSDLMSLGLRSDGTLDVPPDGFLAGYYANAPVPGALGPAVIAGHVDWAGRPGVFFDLRRLEAEDTVTIGREDGSTAVFRVTDVQQYAKDAFPTDLVYGDIEHAGLRLITCGGDFNRRARSYEDNVVVFAELVHLIARRGDI